ncbi:MAG: nucleotide exchange factor GrpE [Myxococcota bacterium]|jgi:molecular chaperone GrpE (heat shock protein)|nr:nucleotide exchange factor GrpE [Myxococcota bacterium]
MSQELTQQAFDALYEELKRYRENFLEEAEKPLLLDLLLFYDSMNWFRSAMEKEESSDAVIRDSFQYLMDEFLEILYRRDVVPMEPNSRFDRSKQRVLKVQTTSDPETHEKVAKVIKRGFKRGDKVLRLEDVEIFRAEVGGKPSP